MTFSNINSITKYNFTVLQQKLKDLDRASVNFFAGRAGYPKFKSKRDKQSIRYPQRFKINGSRIYLPKVGWVRAIFHRPIQRPPSPTPWRPWQA